MEHTVPSENFQRENRTTFSEVQFCPEIFQWNESKNHVLFPTHPKFPKSHKLDKWKTPRQTASRRKADRQTLAGRQRTRPTDDSESNNAQRFCSYAKIWFFSRFRWSRQQAVDFMVENTAMSLHNVNTEVDRYIIWPGQVGSCFPLPYFVQFILSTGNRRC